MTKLNKLDIAKEEMWDLGCKQDIVRNEFIIPELISLITKNQFKEVIDIGAATGYIAIKVDSSLLHKPNWTLIDISGERLRIAKDC